MRCKSEVMATFTNILRSEPQNIYEGGGAHVHILFMDYANLCETKSGSKEYI